jgi:putative Mn2+ efflux pump MntP
MDILTVFIVAMGLAMDCFAVSIASGVILRDLKLRKAFKIGLFFGLFQALMPCVGWLAGVGMKSFISGCDHWIAFGLLGLVGGKMIYESFKPKGAKKEINPLNLAVLLTLSLATSIDALAVGVSMAFLEMAIILPVIIIGAVAFLVSVAGVYAGHRFGHIFGSKIEAAGGMILIAIGLKILIEHL